MVRVEQLTFDTHGHMLNHRQALSPDGKWVLYDTRNEDAHIARTSSIEMLNLDTRETTRLYSTRTQTEYGPGVGAVACHPSKPLAVFIHGLRNCSAEQPYSASRRFGAILDLHATDRWIHAESRCIDSELSKPGVLSGGTHAHSWNHNGWISFTYNDHRTASSRTVGFMLPKNRSESTSDTAVFDNSANDNDESFVGCMHSFIVSKVTKNAKPGSDEIEQAVEECWVGCKNSIAFQGSVRDQNGNSVSEVFAVDLPEEHVVAEHIGSAHDAGVNMTSQFLPRCNQRRLTHTLHRKHPGIQGPRNWLIASQDGLFIYFVARDDRGVVQLFRVSTSHTSSLEVEQVSDLEYSIEGQISLTADGSSCSFVCDQRLCLIDLRSGQNRWLTNPMEHRIVGAIHGGGHNRWLFNAYVGSGADRWLQIFQCET